MSLFFYPIAKKEDIAFRVSVPVCSFVNHARDIYYKTYVSKNSIWWLEAVI